MKTATIVLGGYLVFMLAITLLIFHERSPMVQLRPFVTIRHDWARGGRPFVVNLVGNVVAFLPIGALLPMARGPGKATTAWHAAAFGGVFSLAIELAQGISGRRTCDIDDVLLNTLGSLAGYFLYVAWGRLRPGPP